MSVLLHQEHVFVGHFDVDFEFVQIFIAVFDVALELDQFLLGFWDVLQSYFNLTKSIVNQLDRLDDNFGDFFEEAFLNRLSFLE